MNERIRELAKQVWKEVLSETSIDGDTSTVFSSDEVVMFEQKFAELIVRECIDKIETYRIPVGNSRSGELACEWTYNALKEIRDDIKQQFGVEE